MCEGRYSSEDGPESLYYVVDIGGAAGVTSFADANELQGNDTNFQVSSFSPLQQHYTLTAVADSGGGIVKIRKECPDCNRIASVLINSQM
ncbi:hypothetical protein TcasGA2_TC003313 [Tribolium castaneum]|uniref:Uncharacterized protein n=1 Tax=Tribolium castaneum TaxID=7070 RepID=D6WEY8_TRICA|nr:hypothetical protein TcasGA2_TC003313 [Tribolium castaneum]